MKLPDIYILMVRFRAPRGRWGKWRPYSCAPPTTSPEAPLRNAAQRIRWVGREYRVVKVPAGEYEVVSP